MELAIFLLPLIANTYTIIVRNVFAQSSTKKHIDALGKYGLKGVLFRNPNVLIVPVCFVSSYWYLSVGLFWLILGVVVLLGVAFVLLSPSYPLNLPEPETKEFNDLRIKRQLQTIGTAAIGVAWFLSWEYNQNGF